VKFRFLFIFLSIASVLSAGDFTVIIEGSFPGAEGKNIRLMKYGDQITYIREDIDDAIVDQDGLFGFRFRIYEPVYIFYRIDHARMGHYVEPGNNYKIEFEPVDFDTLDDRRNPYLDPWHFGFDLYNKEAPDKLNKTISAFNNAFDDFLIEHFSDVVRPRLNIPFENFRKHTDSLFQSEIIDNSFFKDYYEYKFALYYRIANIRKPLRLFDDYILDRPVLYENPKYMDFFNTMFDKFLFAGSRSITIEDLLITVNEHNSYAALMDSLGKDTILLNEVLRELVMLKGLKDMYHHTDFNKRNVFSIVEHLHNHSKFRQHRTIAGNILNGFTRLKKSYPAPGFELKKQNGEIICLDDYRGKFVLLNFWTTWCIVCLAEFSLMNDMFEEHKDRFEFISVSVDRNIKDYKRFVEENQLPWDFYHFNDDFRLLDNYDVRGFPLFVLIDPGGNIIRHSAPFPSRGLHKKIARTLYEWDKAER